MLFADIDEIIDGTPEEKPQTNADRIRALSDDELAEWLARTHVAIAAAVLEIANFPWDKPDGFEGGVKEEVLQWLKQPAKEG